MSSCSLRLGSLVSSGAGHPLGGGESWLGAQWGMVQAQTSTWVTPGHPWAGVRGLLLCCSRLGAFAQWGGSIFLVCFNNIIIGSIFRCLLTGRLFTRLLSAHCFLRKYI